MHIAREKTAGWKKKVKSLVEKKQPAAKQTSSIQAKTSS